jgi:hypothetical protein
MAKNAYVVIYLTIARKMDARSGVQGRPHRPVKRYDPLATLPRLAFGRTS